MIAKGLITQRANDKRLPAQTIELDYVLAHAAVLPHPSLSPTPQYHQTVPSLLRAAKGV